MVFADNSPFFGESSFFQYTQTVRPCCVGTAAGHLPVHNSCDLTRYRYNVTVRKCESKVVWDSVADLQQLLVPPIRIALSCYIVICRYGTYSYSRIYGTGNMFFINNKNMRYLRYGTYILLYCPKYLLNFVRVWKSYIWRFVWDPCLCRWRIFPGINTPSDLVSKIKLSIHFL
jgi:hypothetical protein